MKVIKDDIKKCCYKKIREGMGEGCEFFNPKYLAEMPADVGAGMSPVSYRQYNTMYYSHPLYI